MKALATMINQNQTGGFYELTHGIDVDQFLYNEELQVQVAWVQGLADAGIISEVEKCAICSTLENIKGEFTSGLFVWHKDDEDIHMAIERVITDRIGGVGKKIHLGRSRNDLIATTIKIYLANRCDEISVDILNIANGVIELAERDIEIILPAYTHSQAAQPIRLSHIWNFHILNFKNDIKRFKACRNSLLEVMPLGSAAISGTHINIDLIKMAQNLGFEWPSRNSIHAVSDRDGLIEFAHSLAFLGLHIARFCEDIIFLTSSPVRVLKLSPSWSSGSSIMPNKRNPDFFEVVRAKAKRLTSLSGELISLNMGLSSGYVSDLHEQKRSVVLAVTSIQKILPILREAFSSVIVDKNRAGELLLHGHILATDVANRMVEDGVIFRDAYKNVAKEILDFDADGVQIGLDKISFEDAVESRNNFGGTSRTQVTSSTAWLKATI